MKSAYDKSQKHAKYSGFCTYFRNLNFKTFMIISFLIPLNEPSIPRYIHLLSHIGNYDFLVTFTFFSHCRINRLVVENLEIPPFYPYFSQFLINLLSFRWWNTYFQIRLLVVIFISIHANIPLEFLVTFPVTYTSFFHLMISIYPIRIFSPLFFVPLFLSFISPLYYSHKHPYFSFITLSNFHNLYLPYQLYHPIPTCLISLYYYLIESHTLLFSLYLSTLTLNLSHIHPNVCPLPRPLTHLISSVSHGVFDQPSLRSSIYYILSLSIIRSVESMGNFIMIVAITEDCSHSHTRARRHMYFVRS